MSKEELFRVIDEFELILRQSASLADAGLDAHRKSGIALRRQLSAQNAKISALGEKAFETRELQAAFRQEFAKMRSAMAFHQASWPVVTVDLESPEYRASVRTTRAASRQFIVWIRNAMKGE